MPSIGIVASCVLQRLTADTLVEQVLSPLIVRPSHETHDVAAGVKVKCTRFAHQLHGSFGGRLISLAPVARMAAGHKILPSGRASARSGNHMIERQLTGR